MFKDLICLACLLAVGLGIAAEPEIINLARTSLAEVSGSPINGGRAIDDPYYGVLNLFDDGQHRLNNISYTWWLGDKADGWVELRFLAPVTVTAVEMAAPAKVELPLTGRDPKDVFPEMRFSHAGTEPVSLVLYDAERIAAETTLTFPPVPYAPRSSKVPLAVPATPGMPISHACFTFPQPLKGITRIRLNAPQAYARIDEWRVLGIPPADMPYTAGLPRIARTAEGSGSLATGVFRDWLASLGQDVASATEETAAAFITTFRKDGLPLFRVMVDKATGQATVEHLVEWAKREPPQK